MKPSMIVLVGLPASGKSTWARARMESVDGITRYRISWDEMRIEFGHGNKFDRAREEAMKNVSYQRVENAVLNGFQEIIIDNTNLTQSTRDKWKYVAEINGLHYEEMFFFASTEICIQRDSYRNGKAQVGRAVIERMALWADLIVIPHSPSLGAKNIVILDIDGTIANLEHRREILRLKCPFCLGKGSLPCTSDGLDGSDFMCGQCGGKGYGKKDWYNFYKLVSQDTAIQPIIDLAAMLRRSGYRILVVSGRPISWGDLEIGKETVTWLSREGIGYDHLFMRQGGDGREDTIVKQEILDRLPKERIAYCLDDRDSVVKMWRDNGLTTLQVAPGDF